MLLLVASVAQCTCNQMSSRGQAAARLQKPAWWSGMLQPKLRRYTMCPGQLCTSSYLLQ